MNRRNTFLVAAAMLVGATLGAVGGNTTFFTSIGDLVFPFSPPDRSGNPGAIDNMTIGATTPRPVTATTVTADVVRAAIGTYANNPASVASYRSYLFANGQTQMLFEPVGTVAYAYVTFAPAPKDGEQACLFSTQAITALYLNGNTGQSVNAAITAMSANVRYCYTYSLANTTWYRSQ